MATPSADDRAVVALESAMARHSIEALPALWPNELAAAAAVQQAFAAGAVAVSCFGQMQSGKTGVILGSVKLWLEQNPGRTLRDNVLLLGGYSDRLLKGQFLAKATAFFRTSDDGLSVGHRNDVQKQTVSARLAAFEGLVVVDEAHIATEKHCVLTSALRDARLLEVARLQKSRSKLLFVSATPGATLHQLMAWGDALHRQVQLAPGKGYVGVRELMAAGRVAAPRHIDKDAGVADEVVAFVARTWGASAPRVHIVRSVSAKSAVVEALQAAAEARGLAVRVVRCDSHHRHNIVNECLLQRPPVHTFLVIKDFLRCGHNLVKRHVGLLYESKVDNPDCQTVVQGLLGRACGYDVPDDLVVFADVEAAGEWLSFVRNGLKFIDPYTSRTMRVSVTGSISSKESLAHPDVATLGEHDAAARDRLSRESLPAGDVARASAAPDHSLQLECDALFSDQVEVPQQGLCWMPDPVRHPHARYGAMVVPLAPYMRVGALNERSLDMTRLKAAVLALYAQHLPHNPTTGFQNPLMLTMRQFHFASFAQLDLDRLPCSFYDYTKPATVADLLGGQKRKDGSRSRSHHHPAAYLGAFKRERLVLLSQFAVPWHPESASVKRVSGLQPSTTPTE